MKPTDELIAEHNAVLVALQLLAKIEEALATGDKQAPEHLDQIVDFLKGFVDRCHHGKEERHLFPKMHDRGMPAGAGPIAVMLHEHEQGRAAVQAIAGALVRVRGGDHRAASVLSEALLGYVVLLRNHIFKEDNVLFPMADQVLPPDEQLHLADLFDKVEEEEIGEGVHERYHELAHRLGGG